MGEKEVPSGDKAVIHAPETNAIVETAHPTAEHNGILAAVEALHKNSPGMDKFPPASGLLAALGEDGDKGHTPTENKIQTKTGLLDRLGEFAHAGSEDKAKGYPVVQPGEHPFSTADIQAKAASGVDQGKYGDCVFESTVAAVAGTPKGQEQIANMITQGQNGDYVVKFPGDKDPITVSRDDLNKMGTKDSAPWARILETALLKGHPDFADGGKLPDDAPGGTDGAKPTPAQFAMRLLTGQDAGKIDAGDGNVGQQIDQALKDGKPVTAYCKNDDAGALVDGHEWTVTGIDPKTNEITVRNPWGHFDSNNKDGIKDVGDGQVTMPMSTFQKYFGEVTSTAIAPPHEDSTWDKVVSFAENLNPFD